MSTRPRIARFITQLAAPLLLSTLSWTSHAEDYLALEPMKGKRVSIDGMLREWPSGFATLKGKGTSSGSSALIGYDDQFFYFAAKIKDSKIVRTQKTSTGQDRLSVSVYIPGLNAKGTTHRVDIYPGQPGKLAATVRVNGRKISGSDAVENPTQTGYLLEAKVPRSAFPQLKKVGVGLRAVIRYENASAVGRVSSVVTSGSGQGYSMPPLTTEPETGLIQALLQPKGLPLKPDREAYGDLTGKGGVERVALYGHFLSIVGPGYKGGKQFYFNELDVEKAQQITHLSLRDFDGDGKDEIVLQKRLGKNKNYREVIQVLQIGSDGAPLQVFGHEISIVTEEGRIENKLKLQGTGKHARIIIEQGKVKGFDAGNYSEPSIGGSFQSALLPWQTVKSRTFAWKGKGLAAVDESSWEPKMSRPSRGAPHGHAPSSAVAVDAPPPPRAPNADEMLDRVYGLYKQNRKIKRRSTPRFDFVTDVVEDAQMERVLVHDRDLVIFGKGFKKGLSYTYLTIGVKEAQDILSVTARDIVGDGKAEILVHAIVKTQASKSLGGDVVGRQALFIYKVEGENLKRIFAAETGRSLKTNRILGALAFLPSHRGLAIELRSSRAIGWTKKNYPFPEEQHPSGGLEPLLLPWGTVGSRRYVFNGSEYVQQ